MRKEIVYVLLGTSIVVAVLMIGAMVYYVSQDKRDTANNTVTANSFARGAAGGAIAANGEGCAEIGISMLKNGGSVADAAIATLFCDGVTMPMACGIGGGFMLTIYERSIKKATVLLSRETAPAAASPDMFHGDENASKFGGLAVAIPSQVKGLWVLHQKFGKLPWKELVQPSIDLCRNGIVVTPYAASVYKQYREMFYKDTILREVFINKATNLTYKKGERLKMLRQAKTLEAIRDEGADALHGAKGSLIRKLVYDVQLAGGKLAVEDMLNYKPIWTQPVTQKLKNDHTIHTLPLPGSGAGLVFMLNVLDGFLDSSSLYKTENFQKIAETWKFAYALKSHLGDDRFVKVAKSFGKLLSKEFAEKTRALVNLSHTSQDPKYYGADYFVNDDHGTSHLSFLAPNGEAIAVTTTINSMFGAAFASPQTGIILNNEMDDFSAPDITNRYGVPPSPSNFIKPGKFPMSSMVPSIIIKDDDVAMIVGCAGGTMITTQTFLVIIKHLWFDMDLVDAVADKRIHHQLLPMRLDIEKGFEKEHPNIVKDFAKIGHKTNIIQDSEEFAAVTAISTKGGKVKASFDPRRGGSVAFID